MEVQFTPEVQARLDELATETGRAREEFVQDAMAGYFDELSEVRATLDRRFDDLKSGKARLIPGEEVAARFREKSIARRSSRQ